MTLHDIRLYAGPFPLSGTLDVSGYLLDDTGSPATHQILSLRFMQKIPGSGASGEATKFLTTLPTTTDIASGDQAVVTSGVYDSLIFENVSGTITYRKQAGYPIRSSLLSVANADLVAVAIGIGSKMLYVLTDTSGSVSPGVIELTSVDNGLGVAVAVQRSIPFGPSYNSSSVSGLTPVSGWITQTGVSLPDRDVDLGTLQDVERVVKTLINDLMTAGVLTV